MNKLNVVDLISATQAFEKKINLALAYSGLRLPQFKAMLLLEKYGQIKNSELSNHLNVTRPTVSTLINDLLNAGIVASVENKSDKRSFFIKLTESGTNRLAIAKKNISLVEEGISKDLSDVLVITLNDFSSSISKSDNE